MGNFFLKTEEILQKLSPQNEYEVYPTFERQRACKRSTHFDRVFVGGKGYFPTRAPFSSELAPCDFFLFLKP